MATGTYAPNPVFLASDDDGDPLSGALLYTYAAGTVTPLATYSEVTLTTANDNPVVCDSAGRATIFLSPTSYKWILKTSAGVTVWTRDNIGAVPSTNIDNDVTGEAGEALTAVQVAYLSSGTWLKADADATASSTLPTIAFVVANVASGADGTFRLSGRMEGFSGLTPGTDYYVSATAGEITATAPSNSRYVGRADSITSLIITPNPRPVDTTAAVIVLADARLQSLCQGRLSLTTGVPITSADVTAATAIKWVPYNGNRVDLYSGSAWVTFALPELSIAVPATTATGYDLFIDYHATTPFLSVLAWTNLTTRATAITTQEGARVLTGGLTRRFVGSFRTTGVSGQTEDSAAKRYLSNNYFPDERELYVADATTSWTYTTATIRQANGAAGNQVEVFVCMPELELDLTLTAHGANSSGVSIAGGIGEDSTSTFARAAMKSGADIGAYTARLVKKPAIGHHVYSWNEWSAATGTTTFRGATPDSTPTGTTSCLHGWIKG